ncbi:MAG TPA: diguanylate cyclase [Spirochaetia bacterium]|nr:diguanylate cyclase [Spirochaetia bacterium]
MSSLNVLLFASDEHQLTTMAQELQEEGFSLATARSLDESLRHLRADEFQVVILSSRAPDGGVTPAVRAMKSVRPDRPLQVLLLAEAEEKAEMKRSVESGADDFIRVPYDPLELRARARAAQMRWENEENLVKEREFYRVAVAEEERLSSLVLDQNLSLKDAYEKIRRLNEELEKANRELEQIAAFDSLSGLLNRRSLFTRIAIEIERSIRLDVPLTGLMLDIDRFKGINDNFGHQCGDMVIREIGARLQAGLRKYDYAGRYGGEEFFVVLSNTTASQAHGIAERFRRDIDEMRITCGGETIGVTISIGVGGYVPGESQESWIERVDRAMYQAKQSGRNRVVLD